MVLLAAIIAILLVTTSTANPLQPVPRGEADELSSPWPGLGLIERLLLAPTAVDRLALIPNDRDFVYDFQNPPSGSTVTGRGGRSVRADRKLFPALIGSGMSMLVSFLGPCGANTPHVHPRSSAIVISAKGHIGTEFILENGARPISNTLNQYQMTVFPQGAVHTEYNLDCTDSIFVASFANEDPGIQQSAQTLLGLSNDIVNAAFGSDNMTFDGMDIETFRPLIPADVALGVESCLRRCGIPRNPPREV